MFTVRTISELAKALSARCRRVVGALSARCRRVVGERAERVRRKLFLAGRVSFSASVANTKCRAVPIAADRADFVPGPQLQNGTEYELQTFTVTSYIISTRCK